MDVVIYLQALMQLHCLGSRAPHGYLGRGFMVLWGKHEVSSSREQMGKSRGGSQ